MNNGPEREPDPAVCYSKHYFITPRRGHALIIILLYKPSIALITIIAVVNKKQAMNN